MRSKENAQNPFSQKSEKETHQPLQLVHSDLCGPMNVDSVGGSKYVITFIDDDTGFVTADHASRGLSAEQLMRSNWFIGPASLWEKDIPDSKEEIPNIRIGDRKLRQLYALLWLKNLST